MEWIGKIGREENRVYFRENSLVSKGRRDRANSFLSFLAIDQPIRDSHEKNVDKKNSISISSKLLSIRLSKFPKRALTIDTVSRWQLFVPWTDSNVRISSIIGNNCIIAFL